MTSGSSSSADPKRTWVDRALSLFAKVKAGEGVGALVLSLEVCVLLCAYYVLKPVREALILESPSGAELKSYASVGQIALLALIVPGYSALVSRFDRGRLIRFVTLFFVACLVGFYLLAKLDVPGLGLAFFLWVGVFNLMVVAQFWAFASDLYSRDQGERLFPIVAFGASIGAVAGSQLTSVLVDPLGVPTMMLVSAGLLLGALFLGGLADRCVSGAAREPRSAPPEKAPPEKQTQTGGGGQEAGVHGGFRLVARSRYLLLIGLLMLLLNFSSSTGEFLLSSLVKEHAEKVAPADVTTFISEFYSNFYFWVNLVGVLIQLFVTSHLLHRFGVRTALMVLPALALVFNIAIAVMPILLVVRWTKVTQNAVDYSLNNTVRNALFLPLTAAEKYKSKQVVDTIFVRAGDVLAAGLVFVGSELLQMSISVFALVNVVVIALWLLVAVRLGLSYERKDAASAGTPGPDAAGPGAARRDDVRASTATAT